MDADREEAVNGLDENQYMVVAIGDSAILINITAERYLFGSASNAIGALVGLIAFYYTFDIVYPKPLYPIYIFLQHFVFKIVDTQKIPETVKRSYFSIIR